MGIKPFDNRELEQLRAALPETSLPPYAMSRLLATVDTLRQSVMKQAMAHSTDKYGTHARWAEFIQDESIRALVGLSSRETNIREA